MYEANGTTERTLPDYLSYSVTYSDGVVVAVNQKLSANSTETYKVRVEYKTDIEASQIPSSADTIVFKFNVTYVQADSNATPVSHPITKYGVYGGIYDSGSIEKIYLNQAVPSGITLRSTPAAAISDWNNIYYRSGTNRTYYLKHVLENNIVKESYACFIVSQEMVQSFPEATPGTYCLRGGLDETAMTDKPIYESNKQILQRAFGSDDCTEDDSYIRCNYYSYSAGKDGYVSIMAIAAWDCNITSSGESYCRDIGM